MVSNGTSLMRITLAFLYKMLRKAFKPASNKWAFKHKDKVLTEKSVSGTAKSQSLVCAKYNLIYNFIIDTYLSLSDQTAGSLLGTNLVSKINDLEEVTNGSQPK